VIIKTPTLISKSTQHFSVVIDAKYTFGKPVFGIATVKATPILQTQESWSKLDQPATITSPINGKVVSNFSTTSFVLPNNQAYELILIEASVQEMATGIIRRGFDKTIKVESNKMQSEYVILISNFNFYLPNKPYLIKVQVKNRDGRHLYSNRLSIDFQVIFDSDTFKKAQVKKYKLDANGKCEILVDVPAHTKESIKFRVS
jgi:hypothetical protein